MQRKKQIVIMVIVSVLLLSMIHYKNNKAIVLADNSNNNQLQIEVLKKNIESYKNKLKTKDEKIKSIVKTSRHLDDFFKQTKNAIDVIVTAYDLSEDSTGKIKGDKDYGITSDGSNLENHTRKSARTIAVDTKIIPMGSIVYVQFKDKKYSKYDGIYIAHDRGGAIKKYHIDLFMGDFKSKKPHKSVMDFGVTKAKITIIK